MKTHATSLPQTFKVLNAGTFPEGDSFIEISCIGYEAFTALPAGMKYDGKVYALTGWNSDRQTACYKTDVKLGWAKP
jgi:hypothetical protein